MGKTYRQMQRDVKEYRKQHPEFWCRVNVSYTDMIKLHRRIQELQQASTKREQPALCDKPKIIEINVPVVQVRTIPVYVSSNGFLNYSQSNILSGSFAT